MSELLDGGTYEEYRALCERISLANQAAREAAAEITRLQKELDTAREALEVSERDRDYWKVESEGETAKVVYRDRLLKTAREDALEEAAAEVDRVTRELGYMPNCTYTCASIRALKDKEVAG